MYSAHKLNKQSDSVQPWCPPFPILDLSIVPCLVLWDPLDCSLPGFSVHGILQARMLEWVAMPSSRGSSWPRNQAHISCVSCIAGGFFICWAIREALFYVRGNTRVWAHWHHSFHMCLSYLGPESCVFPSWISSVHNLTLCGSCNCWWLSYSCLLIWQETFHFSSSAWFYMKGGVAMKKKKEEWVFLFFSWEQRR